MTKTFKQYSEESGVSRLRAEASNDVPSNILTQCQNIWKSLNFPGSSPTAYVKLNQIGPLTSVVDSAIVEGKITPGYLRKTFVYTISVLVELRDKAHRSTASVDYRWIFDTATGKITERPQEFIHG